ncbi:hypothetical protein KYN89_08495 [Alteriqipengyuania sp. NZ-12B]|uniref:DUF4870 domain-containing protein n=1 Tax=Alteriqipengyuania abyssalis TaxID=2860200 RepID=A0ABS7PF32_9SPHN|nr:hypothetical protein [Alteriqipengyuania abyssalis]MBY8337088.1 hypothetical protein [Alteriqipengyuania abyssalis]
MSEWDDTREGRTAQTGVTFQRPAIVAGLYLATLVLGLSVFVGLILAYVWRGENDGEPWEESHFTYLIRTFWIGFGVSVAMVVTVLGVAVWIAAADSSRSDPSAALVTLVVVGFGLLTIIWYCVRSVLSLVAAANRRPMPNPQTWWF